MLKSNANGCDALLAAEPPRPTEHDGGNRLGPVPGILLVGSEHVADRGTFLVYDETHVDRRIAQAIVLNRHLGRLPERGLVRGEVLEDVQDMERRDLASVNA
jgi:hypothetical protein